jgi:hypothetical protein
MQLISEFQLEFMFLSIFHQIFTDELGDWFRLTITNFITAMAAIVYAKKKAEKGNHYTAIY